MGIAEEQLSFAGWAEATPAPRPAAVMAHSHPAQRTLLDEDDGAPAKAGAPKAPAAAAPAGKE
jgi:hypothetical protein